jgi:hypothetical protein
VDPPAKIDFSRSSNVWCLYAAIMLAAAILLLNPLVLALIISMTITRAAYLLFLDALLVAIIVFCLRYLRFGHRRDGVLAIGLAALLPLAMIVIEPAIITSYQAWRPAATQDVAIHEANAELGWQPVPGARARHVSNGNFDVTYGIDAQGRRQTPAGPNAARTLHFFGDSILFGHGVADGKTALDLVADALGDRANVVNYGVMGYGLEQMFLRLRDSQDIRPGDAVIFAPIAEDLERNLIGKTFVCTIYQKNYAEARTFPLLEDGTWRAAPIGDYCPDGDLPIALAKRYLMARQRPALDQELAANADKIFAMAASVAKERGAEFFVLFLVRADECESGAFLFDLDRLETPFASLLPACPPDPSALRFATDRHYNEAGQRWLAASILDFLERDVLPAR